MSHESQPNPTPEPTPIPTAGEGQFANSETDPQLASFGMKREAGHPHQIDVIGGDMSPQPVEVHGLKEKLKAPIREPHSPEELESRRATKTKGNTARNIGRGMLTSLIAIPAAMAIGHGIKNTPDGIKAAGDAIVSTINSKPTVDEGLERIKRNVDAINQSNDSRDAAIAAGADGNFEPPVFELPPENPQP